MVIGLYRIGSRRRPSVGRASCPSMMRQATDRSALADSLLKKVRASARAFCALFWPVAPASPPVFATPSESRGKQSLACLILLLVALTAPSFADTEVSGNVSGEWNTDGSPYVLIDNATVPDNDTLIIDPGVEVRFGEDLTLTVNGLIRAVGTEDDTIRFRGPEGLVSGGLQINDSDEDTLYFAYCRFDSMQYAIYALEHILMVESCRFADSIYIRLEGGSAIIRSNDFTHNSSFILREGNDDLKSIAVVDNRAYRTDIQILNAGTAVAKGNTSFNYRLPDNPRYSRISFVDCGRVEASDNVDYEAELINSYRDGAVIENNRLGRLLIANNQDWGVEARNNYIGNLKIVNAYAEIANNDIDEVLVAGGIPYARIEQSLLREGVVVEDSCFVELRNNTLVMPAGYPDDARAVRVIGVNEYQSTVTAINNIFVSYGGLPYAVAEDVDNVEGGYNCFWGFEGTYEGREDNLEGDIVQDPQFVGGHPYEYQLQANSPCIDAGDPDSAKDPDSTRADIGAYIYNQANGMPPAIISRHDVYTGWGMEFRYAARATDMSGAIVFEFADLPDWLQEEGRGRRDFVSDSAVVSGQVPEDQEDFVFMVTARDEGGLEDTLSVQVFAYPFTVLTGQIGGMLTREHSPYLVADTAWVAEDDSLILEPGCQIFFDNVPYEGRGQSLLIVKGRTSANGTQNDSITFASFTDSLERSYIILDEGKDNFQEFSYCHFKSAGISSLSGGLSVSHCMIDSGARVGSYNVRGQINFCDNRVSGYGPSLMGHGLISSNIFIGLGDGASGVDLWGDSVIFSNNVLSGFNSEIFIAEVREGIIRNNLITNGRGDYSQGIYLHRYNTDYDYSHITIESNMIANVFNGIGGTSRELYADLRNNLISNINYGIISWCDTTYAINNVVCGATMYAYKQIWNPHISVVCNNLFLGDSILFDLYEAQPNRILFAYNACSHFDTLLNDMGYIGKIDRVNANGDSCDAGFNIFLDPKIVSLDSLDFHLYAGSPLINAGNPDSSFDDLDGTVNDIGLFGGPFGESYVYPEGVGKSDIPPPEGFTLSSPYPNPFNKETLLSFGLPAAGDVEIRVYDVTGRQLLREIMNGVSAGNHRYLWRGEDNAGRSLPTGIYYLELTFKGAKLVKPVVMVK